MAADKVKFGIKNVYYAKYTAGSYSTPVAMPGAVSLSLTPNGDTNTFYADDIRYYVTVANNGYDAELEVAALPETFYTDILKMTLDNTAKVYYEKAGVQPEAFALLFEEEGDAKGTKFVLYNCTAQRPTRNLSTTTDSIEPHTQTLSITAMPLPTSNEIIAFTGENTTTSVLSGWYTSVWQHT